jgi:hypothetical protein
VLISVSFGLPIPEFGGLLIPAMPGRFHEKVVPRVPLVGRYENTVLLHIAGGVRLLVSVGIGFTATTTF